MGVHEERSRLLPYSDLVLLHDECTLRKTVLLEMQTFMVMESVGRLRLRWPPPIMRPYVRFPVLRWYHI